MRPWVLAVALVAVLEPPGLAAAQAADAPAPEAPAPDAPAPIIPRPEPVDVEEERTATDARAAAAIDATASQWRVRTRHDVVISWAPRYRLDTSTDPLGLEQQIWRAVDALPLYHRVSLDATLAIDESTSLGVHFSGWGSVDLLGDTSGGGLAAGDVAIGYVELSHQPLSAWAGRRFLTYGPPGGLHVDGGGAGVRSDVGLFADAFVGRPVTPIRTSLLGPQPDFTDTTVAYGARVGYEDAGTLALSASYAELWGHGVVGTRTIDVTGVWDPGVVHFEASVKVDALRLGVTQARAVAMVTLARELQIDLDYLHVEPARWIPAWSILSVFETNDFDEAMGGVTLRPSRTVALRGEGAARIYSMPSTGERHVGYRADLSFRMMPGVDQGTSLRVQGSRRDDGVLGYTVLTLGTAFDVWQGVIVAIDGAFAIDDAGARLTTIGRANVDFDVLHDLRLGATVSLARTTIADAELRAMLRARWAVEASR